VRQSSIATLKAPTAYAHKGQILEQLQDAVQEHEVIAIVHQKPGNLAPRERAVEPYALWFTDGGFIRELDRCERHRDHGLPSMVAWLSWRFGLGPVAAREKVRVAKALATLPEIDLAFSRAEVSYSKVRAMTRIATPETEAKLSHMARKGSAAQLETLCRGVEQVTGTSPDALARWVRSRPCKEGMVRIEIRVHADEAALLMKAIDAAVEEA